MLLSVPRGTREDSRTRSTRAQRNIRTFYERGIAMELTEPSPLEDHHLEAQM